MAVHLPAFRLERCGWAPEDLAVLIAFERNAMRVVALTPSARDAGLHVGMSVSEARSVDPSIHVEVFEPEAEALDRGELVRAFERLSDHVQAAGDQDLLLELRHMRRALGGERAALDKAVKLGNALGHRVQVALTDDPLGALALARAHARPVWVAPGEMAAALSTLGLRDLALPENLLERLRALGIRTLGAFANLDPASVAGRFGPPGVRLHQLATGRCQLIDATHLFWIDDALPRVQADLGGATTTLQLHFVLPGLLGQLSRALGERDRAVVQLLCSLHLDTGSTTRFGVRVGRPTRQVAVLETLVRARLESVKLAGAVEAFSIEVREDVASIGWQPGLTDRSSATEPLPDLLARLQDTLGEQAVFAAELVDGWQPEKTWKPIPLPLLPTPARPVPASEDVVLRQEVWERALRWARPTQLMGRPEPLRVRKDGQGRWTSVLLPEGVWARVEKLSEPECLSGAWWLPHDAWERVYRVVSLQGGRLAWVFQSDEHAYLHGWF